MSDLHLTWTEAVAGTNPIAGYKLYDADTDVLITETSDLEHTISDVDPGIYRFYVTALDTTDFESGHSNTIELEVEDPGVDGELMIWPNAVLFHRSQSGIGVLRTANGYVVSAGVADFTGNPVKAVVWGMVDFSVRIHGTDEDSNVITEDISCSFPGVGIQTGTTDFTTITGVTLLSTSIGADGFYTVGYRQQVTLSTSGFNLVKDRCSLAMRATESSAAVSLSGTRNIEFGAGLPETLPDDSTITIMRYLNTAAKTFTINGTESLVLPIGAQLQEVKSVTAYDTLTALLAGSGSTIFYDIGLEYRAVV